MAEQLEVDRKYTKPYGSDNPVPSIQHYREIQEERQNDDATIEDTSEAISGDVKQKRKALRKEDRKGRIVTDPITHLPVRIHDFTEKAIESISENSPPYGSTPATATGRKNRDKQAHQLQDELRDIVRGQAVLQAEFPPPSYEAVHADLVRISKHSIYITLASLSVIASALIVIRPHHIISAAIVLGTAVLLIVGVSSWADRRIKSLWDGAVWRGKFNAEVDEETETTVWLNSLLSAVWPLINPDLFTALGDEFEDVMQASLPSIVRMISVDDIGQGSESFRILGIRWLPTAAATRSINADGEMMDDEGKRESQQQNQPEDADDVTKSAQHAKISETNDGVCDPADDPVKENQEQAEIPGEDGEFVNLEVAFAYRSSSSGNSFKDRIKDMHLCLSVYLPGNIKIPIWADLRGAIGMMRLRIQLSPDPPFFAQCTMTLLGQPKIEVSCTPLLKQGLNIMNLPIINNFVQSSIDAAIADYVAPKSLTLDLKDMISGDDFKKDTVAYGVLLVKIVRGYDFKAGDIGIPLIKSGGADPYVTVGWAKFGKPLWSTRILDSQMQPDWQETTYVLVTPQELHVDERLRIQLWDSDRFTADDDLGRIEVDVKKLMRTKGRQKRTDGFRALKAGETMPGKLEWEVEYCPKVEIQRDQLQKQTAEDIRSLNDLDNKAQDVAETKLKELPERDRELKKQKTAEWREHEQAMLISAPPPEEFPSGIISIQVHQITELELQSLNAKQDDDGEVDLPSSYCTIIINHEKVYETRTKPKNARPFFNAATERFIPDWRSAEVHIAVRDSRVHEDDPLLGIVHLSLHDLFEKRTQRSGFWPLAGGVGYGSIRLSFVWRSVTLQAPSNMLGWNIGTAEIHQANCNVEQLSKLKMKMSTNIGAHKMHQGLRLGFHDRYSSALTIRFRERSITGKTTKAFAILWLRDIPDEDESEVELDVLAGDFKEAMKSAEPEGEKLGTLKMRLTLWAGLGTAHHKWAKKQASVREVMQTLEASQDNLDDSRAAREAGIIDEDASSDDKSSSSDDEEGESKAGAAADKSGSAGAEEDTTQKPQGALSNLIDGVKDYKDNQKRIHRRNRGIMTWKAPRTAKWAVHNASDKLESGISRVFKRHSRHSGVETEV